MTPIRRKLAQRMTADQEADVATLVHAWGGSANAAINRAVREAAAREEER